MPRPPRPDQELAEAALSPLAAAGVVEPGARVAALTQLEGGWSRHTWALTVADAAEAEREFIVRVKPPGSLLETSLEQEYLTYRVLERHAIPVPRAHAIAAADNPFGGEFFVLDRAPGTAPNTWRRGDREALARDWEEGGGLARDLVEILSRIHAIPGSEAAEVLPRRDFAAAVEHWRAVQREMSLVDDPVVEEAYEWLLANPVALVEPRLVHGDYRIGNCLVENGRISAVLDWELAFYGDARFDLGYCGLAYLAGKFTRPGSELLCAVADREWFYGRYAELSGEAVDEAVVRAYAVLGALMLIAILTTGARVYRDGRSGDVRMAWSRFAIPGLRQDIAREIGW